MDGFSDKEFDNNYGVVINTSYNILNTENTEKQYLKVCQGNLFCNF